MTKKRQFAAATLMLILSSVFTVYGQRFAGSTPTDAKTTPAYGVLVLRNAAIKSELQRMLTMLKEGHPDVRIKKIEVTLLGREMDRMTRTKASRMPKLTHTYGELILRQVAVELELKTLLTQVKEQHPEVRNKKVELSILRREIEKVLE